MNPGDPALAFGDVDLRRHFDYLEDIYMGSYSFFIYIFDIKHE